MRVTALRAALCAAVLAPVALSSQDQTVRIRAAKALDGTGKVLSNVTITIQGSKITSIGPDTSGAATYYLGTLTAMPGMRTMVHAHSPESIKASVNAGCQQIEHGVFATDEVLKLMADKGVYFDPNVGVVLQNYLANKSHYLGIGNYNEEGFAFMEKGLALNAAMIKKAVATPKLMMVIGTDAVAGAHGHNADEIVARVRQGGQKPMDAIVSATSLAARSMRLEKTIGTLAPGYEADIIALDGDPTSDINAVKRVAFVMRAGKVYKSIRN